MFSLSWKRSVLGLSLLSSALAQVKFHCDPCIERDTYQVKAIVHGSDTDPFWQQMDAAMVQAAKDMKVDFEFVFAGKEDRSDMASVYQKMASEIESAAKKANALVVSIPDAQVQTAVEAAIQGGTPVFGVESGYDVAKAAGLSAFIGMDDEVAGKKSAEEITKTGATVSQALFVEDTSNAATAQAQSRRKDGFTSGLSGASVTTVQLEGVAQADTQTTLENSFEGCSYEAVLLGVGSDELVTKTLAALESKGCKNVMVGTFGTSVAIHQAVSAGKLLFAVSQQPYLQGAMSLVHAALYVSTGKHLAPSSESQYGMVLSGPEMITKDNSYTDTFQVCEADAFPVCPNDKALDGSQSKCECTERPKMKIAGVLHAVTTDRFWDIVYTASNQAADDFGVALELDRMEPDEADVLHLKMAGQIQKLCNEGVDGIFVTIPSEAVLEAIKMCQRLKIPVVSINAGPDFSRDLGLQHHLGMVEFNAGYLAGQRMAATGQITKGVCLDHAPGNIVLIDRCGGFKKAMDEAGIPYLGNVTVPDDNAQLYVSNVEIFIKNNNNDEWTGLGVLLGGSPQHVPGLMLKDNHPEILVGTFDTSDDFYKGIEEGKIMFGMDQGPYLQGYLPVPLLAWQAQTMQNSINHLIESGPDFVVNSPTKEKQTCEANHFKSCDWFAGSTGTDASGTGTTTTEEKKDTGKDNKGAIAALSIVAVVCVLSIAFLAYRMHLLKKYVHRLEEEGRSPPGLSAGDYVASAFIHPEKIIQNKAGAVETSDPSASEAC